MGFGREGDFLLGETIEDGVLQVATNSALGTLLGQAQPFEMNGKRPSQWMKLNFIARGKASAKELVPIWQSLNWQYPQLRASHKTTWRVLNQGVK